MFFKKSQNHYFTNAVNSKLSSAIFLRVFLFYILLFLEADAVECPSYLMYRSTLSCLDTLFATHSLMVTLITAHMVRVMEHFLPSKLMNLPERLGKLFYLTGAVFLFVMDASMKSSRELYETKKY